MTPEQERAKRRAQQAADDAWGRKNEPFFHASPKPDKCKHEFSGWRDFHDGNGGEQVCKKCGIGAMAYTLQTGF